MPRLLQQPTKILLTGASSGIGLQMLHQLSERGHSIIAVSRTASAISACPGMAAFDCDLADPNAVVAMLDRICAEHPDIGLVINNAAVQLPYRLDDPRLEDQGLVMEAMLNIVAPAIIARHFVTRFKSADGPTAIVNISSGLAFHPKTQTALYCASKAAIHSFTQSLRYQIEGSTINAIEVILPLVDTPMTEGRGSGKMAAADAARAVIAGIEAGKSEIYVGKARLLRLLNRLAPSIPKRILRAS